MTAAVDTVLSFTDDGVLLLDPAAVGRLESKIHRPDHRPCVHLLTKRPPTVLVLDHAAVGRLNFQPRTSLAPQPCIASRRGDVLTIAFDQAGSTRIDDRRHTGRTPRRWTYQLHRAQWASQDTPDPAIVAAVLTGGGDGR